MQDPALQRAIRVVEERLADEFGERIGSEEIRRRTHASLHRYHNARVWTYVPLLVHRDVREDVRAETQPSRGAASER